jgi:transposase
VARTAAFTQDDLDRAGKLRDSHMNERDCRAALIVLLIAERGLTREEAADIFGIDIKTVFNDMERIRNTQPENERGGRHNCLMTVDEEARFHDKFSEKAKSVHNISMP